MIAIFFFGQMIPTLFNNQFKYVDKNIIKFPKAPNISSNVNSYSIEGFYDEPLMYRPDTLSSQAVINTNTIKSNNTYDTCVYYLSVTGSLTFDLGVDSIYYIDDVMYTNQSVTVSNNMLIVISKSDISYSGNGSVTGYIMNIL